MNDLCSQFKQRLQKNNENTWQAERKKKLKAEFGNIKNRKTTDKINETNKKKLVLNTKVKKVDRGERLR